MTLELKRIMVNKSKFLNLLKNPTNIEENVLLSIEEMAATYPYCQAFHVLIAKGYDTLSKGDFEKKLNHAAVYTADRKHLKDIIINDLFKYPSSVNDVDKPAPAHVEDNSEIYSEEYLKDKILAYLEKLRTEKAALDIQSKEGLSEELAKEKAVFKNELDIKIAEAEAKLARLQNPSLSKKTKKQQEKTKKEAQKKHDSDALYNELEKNLLSLQAHKDKVSSNKEEEPSQEIDKELFTPLSNNVEKERMEEYLASLKATDLKSIENEKVREQIKLIDNFIENEPKLPKLDQLEDDREKREDLSLRSLQVGENLASENLALIMAKQGKLEKAEEIYNKLIWKFPEKKAYFVARIEELKKK